MQTPNGGGLNVTNEKMGMVIALGTAAVSAAGGVFVEKYLAEPPSQSTSIVRPISTAAAAAAAAVAAADGIDRAPERRSMLWEQQGVLALFSAAFADLYLLLFLPEAVRGRELLRGWTPMTAVLMCVQALQGIVVARAIQRFGIVVRLILGTISICLCIVAEGALLMEPVAFREGLSIVLVILGSTMYQQSAHAAGSKAAAAASQQQQAPRACAHCGWKGQPAGAGQGHAGGGEGLVPETEGGIFRKIMGTRLRRHSPTPLDDRDGRSRWW